MFNQIISILRFISSLLGDTSSADEQDTLRREYGDLVPPRSLEQARRFAQVEAEAYVDDYRNHHQNIYSAMFWGGADTETLVKYYDDHLADGHEV